MPSVQCRIGVWENESFRGVVLFGIGAGASTNGTKYGLASKGEVAELVRVALRSHMTTVSRIVSIAIKMMKKENPGIRLLISFADEMGQGHLGKIYQAGNWIYAGAFDSDGGWIIHGNVVHTRTITSRPGWHNSGKWLRDNVDKDARKPKTLKHRYLMPLDDEIRERVLAFSKPYPRAKQETAPQGYVGGAAPTRTLHSNQASA